MSADLYAAPQHVGHTHVAQVAPEATLAAPGGRSMHDRASELRRISLPRTWVNKGTRKGRGCYYAPALVRYLALPFRRDMTVRRDDGWLLRPFVVTLDVYAFDRKPEEKRKFPKERTYASNQAKCLCVLGENNVSIGIYQIAQG